MEASKAESRIIPEREEKSFLRRKFFGRELMHEAKEKRVRDARVA